MRLQFLLLPSKKNCCGPRSASRGATIEVPHDEVDPAERGSFGTGRGWTQRGDPWRNLVILLMVGRNPAI